MPNKISNITNNTKDAIKRKSAYSLPDRPSDQGMKPDEIKRAFWQPIVDVTYSSLAEIDRVINEINNVFNASYDAHLADANNPHSVTKAQIGLGNCDNTADADKPLSFASRAAIDYHDLDTMAHKKIRDAITNSLALKSSIADIQDTFISTAADKPLSAYRGKILFDSLQTTDGKAEQSIKSISLNSANGILTITKTNGTISTIDLPLEYMVQGGRYDAVTKNIVLELAGGTTIEIPAAALVNEYYGDNSTVTAYTDTADGNKVKFKLSDTVLEKVNSNTNARHSHANKAILDATNAAFTTSLKTTYDGYSSSISTNTSSIAEIKTGQNPNSRLISERHSGELIMAEDTCEGVASVKVASKNTLDDSSVAVNHILTVVAYAGQGGVSSFSYYFQKGKTYTVSYFMPTTSTGSSVFFVDGLFSGWSEKGFCCHTFTMPEDGHNIYFYARVFSGVSPSDPEVISIYQNIMIQEGNQVAFTTENSFSPFLPNGTTLELSSSDFSPYTLAGNILTPPFVDGDEYFKHGIRWKNDNGYMAFSGHGTEISAFRLKQGFQLKRATKYWYSEFPTVWNSGFMISCAKSSEGVDEFGKYFVTKPDVDTYLYCFLQLNKGYDYDETLPFYITDIAPPKYIKKSVSTTVGAPAVIINQYLGKTHLFTNKSGALLDALCKLDTKMYADRALQPIFQMAQPTDTQAFPRMWLKPSANGVQAFYCEKNKDGSIVANWLKLVQ